MFKEINISNFTIRQEALKNKINEDSLWLCSFIEQGPNQKKVMELGSGSGLISIFIEKMDVIIQQIDPGSRELTVAHLGDGNIHYAIYPTKFDEILFDKLTNCLEEITQELGGSFSAEHGIGISKKKSMARRKDPVALEVMRSIKIALDPKNLMNPGKVLPDP